MLTEDDKLPGMVDCSQHRRAKVVGQRRLAKDTWAIRLDCPSVAARILPGQFFMVRSPGDTEPLLGRPFALFDIYEENGKPQGVEFGYLVVGKLTSLMTSWRAGDEVEFWGPLGNGFPTRPCKHLMCVAGGIGQTPFLAVVNEALGHRSYGEPHRTAQRPQRVSMCYGVRSSEYLAGVEDFNVPGLEFHVATDDGSAGYHGYVTELLKNSLQANDSPDLVYCCGPEPMMKAVSEICGAAGVECLISLETPMACGFGACFSCVTRIRMDDGSWDYRRTCVEGPVFAADRVIL
jgi:dihydroorotate dehydrogenase electron transfer subunit